MSEEDNNLNSEDLLNQADQAGEGLDQQTPAVEDFDQNGMLLKIAVNGITVQDLSSVCKKVISL